MEPIYIPRALNMGTCINCLQRWAGWSILFCRPTQEPVSERERETDRVWNTLIHKRRLLTIFDDTGITLLWQRERTRQKDKPTQANKTVKTQASPPTASRLTCTSQAWMHSLISPDPCHLRWPFHARVSLAIKTRCSTRVISPIYFLPCLQRRDSINGSSGDKRCCRKEDEQNMISLFFRFSWEQRGSGRIASLDNTWCRVAEFWVIRIISIIILESGFSFVSLVRIKSGRNGSPRNWVLHTQRMLGRRKEKRKEKNWNIKIVSIKKKGGGVVLVVFDFVSRSWKWVN